MRILCADEWAVHLLPCNSSRLKWFGRHCTAILKASPSRHWHQSCDEVSPRRFPSLCCTCTFQVSMYMYSTRYVYMHNAIKRICEVLCCFINEMNAWLGGEDKSPLQEGSKAKKQLPYLLQNSGGSNGSEEVKNLAIMSHIIIGTLVLKIVCVKFYNYVNHCGSNVPIWMSMFILAFVLVRWPSHALSCLVYVFFLCCEWEPTG